LEVAAGILHTDIRELSKLASKADFQLDINSVCVVFAESEIIGLISQGYQTSTIVRAVHRTIAKRLVNLASQLRWQEPVVFTGGVAHNSDIVQLCEREMKTGKIFVPADPTLTAALGAALMVAQDKAENHA
jgi:activator of 2-hydroxyglutaryl-CoA dehydratase